MDAFVVAYYRARADTYRAVIPAFPTEDVRGETLAALADDARSAIADRLGVDLARVRVELVAMTAYAAALVWTRRSRWAARRAQAGAPMAGEPSARRGDDVSESESPE